MKVPPKELLEGLDSRDLEEFGLSCLKLTSEYSEYTRGNLDTILPRLMSRAREKNSLFCIFAIRAISDIGPEAHRAMPLIAGLIDGEVFESKPFLEVSRFSEIMEGYECSFYMDAVVRYSTKLNDYVDSVNELFRNFVIDSLGSMAEE